MNHFWNWQACRTFIEQAIKYYEEQQVPPWVTDWLNDLYIRLAMAPRSIILDEILTLEALFGDEVWEPGFIAVNQIYKLFDRLGKPTTGLSDH